MKKQPTPPIVDPVVTEKVNKLLDDVLAKESLKNDAALSRTIAEKPPVISKLRHGHLPFGSRMILKFHETFGIPVAELRARLS